MIPHLVYSGEADRDRKRLEPLSGITFVTEILIFSVIVFPVTRVGIFLDLPLEVLVRSRKGLLPVSPLSDIEPDTEHAGKPALVIEKRSVIPLNPDPLAVFFMFSFLLRTYYTRSWMIPSIIQERSRPDPDSVDGSMVLTRDRPTSSSAVYPKNRWAKELANWIFPSLP